MCHSSAGVGIVDSDVGSGNVCGHVFFGDRGCSADGGYGSFGWWWLRRCKVLMALAAPFRWGCWLC